MFEASDLGGQGPILGKSVFWATFLLCAAGGVRRPIDYSSLIIFDKAYSTLQPYGQIEK